MARLFAQFDDDTEQELLELVRERRGTSRQRRKPPKRNYGPKSGGGVVSASPSCPTPELNNRGTLAIRNVAEDCTSDWAVVPVVECDGGLQELPGTEPS